MIHVYKDFHKVKVNTIIRVYAAIHQFTVGRYVLHILIHSELVNGLFLQWFCHKKNSKRCGYLLNENVTLHYKYITKFD